MARIIVLTGEREVGKSTVCHKVVDLAQDRDHACSGLITLARANDERALLDVSSGNTRQLTLDPDATPAIIQGRFRFDPEVMQWGNRILAEATPCDLFVVDELGPLELEQDWGWVGALDILRQANFALALVVVRPELVIRAQMRLPGMASTVLAVTHDNRDQLPSMLLEMLERELASSTAD